MKPYNNKDEMEEDFDRLFPEKKRILKIIVAEVEDKIAFAVHLFIKYDPETKQPIGHMHDFLMNRHAYGDLKNAEEV